MKTILIKTSVIVFIFAMASLFSSCKKNEDEGDASSNKPKIVGCNSVSYQGYTFNDLGCEVGIASFDIDMTQNGHSGSFHVTCSNGCISSVTIK